MSQTLLLLLLLLSLSSQNLTTKDPDFVQKFKVKHLKEGDGKTFPRNGESVQVHYEGTLVDGKKFDSSYDRKQPLSFTLGVGQVIKCWDMSVARLSKGEKIQVTCPYDLAYGERGIGGVIPPKADLVFVMELVGIGGSDL